jgi:DNA-binding MarR family transcriptional regulator
MTAHASTSEVQGWAEDLRWAIGEVVRATRTVDTVPSGEAAVLGLLDREGPLTIVELAKLRGVRHQTVAKTVSQLAYAELVDKGPQPGDARMVSVRLTTNGRRVLKAERTRRARWLAEAIDKRLDAHQRALLPATIEILRVLAER